MTILLFVMAGGALGAGARYLLASQVGRWLGSGFPWGTLAVNVLGAFVMGLLVGLFARFWSPSESWRAFMTVGLLGGFTTFSAFSLETVLLLERGQAGLAIFYAVASVLLCVGVLLLALWLTRSLPQSWAS